MNERGVNSPGSFGPITVLCVDSDVESVADTLRREREAFSVVSASTPRDALSRLDAESYDCIVSGHHLPDWDGITFLRRVREEYSELPFILLARAGSEEVAAEAVNADVDGYFRFENGDVDRRLGDRIETVVGEYRTRQTQVETKNQLLQLTESSDSAVWLFTADWSELVYINSAYEDIWGRSRDALEEDPTDFLKGIHPDDRETVKAEMATLTNGEPAELEYRVNSEEDYQRWVKVQGEPVLDDFGNVAYVAGFARDITSRKRRGEQLQRQNQEMEVFNSLLRHDILNGITVIRARAVMLSDELNGDQQQYAETIVEWSDNITGLVQRIRDVLNTLTGEEPELERVNLCQALHEQIKTVDASYPEVTLETDIPAGVFVQANELLPDVFKNLLTNAVEHNEPDGLRIECTAEVEGDIVTVRVADNGCGVPDELKDEIFRRGRTGHVKSTGSGFGLFFVDAMVTAYGGTIHVEDNRTGGATFVIELPTQTP